MRDAHPRDGSSPWPKNSLEDVGTRNRLGSDVARVRFVLKVGLGQVDTRFPPFPVSYTQKNLHLIWIDRVHSSVSGQNFCPVIGS